MQATGQRERRRFNVLAPCDLFVPAVVRATGDDRFKAAEAVLPTICADFGKALLDDAHANLRPGSLTTPKTLRDKGLRFTAWLEPTGATFGLVYNKKSSLPTPQTLHVEVERDDTAPAAAAAAAAASETAGPLPHLVPPPRLHDNEEN